MFKKGVDILNIFFKLNSNSNVFNEPTYKRLVLKC